MSANIVLQLHKLGFITATCIHQRNHRIRSEFVFLFQSNNITIVRYNFLIKFVLYNYSEQYFVDRNKTRLVYDVMELFLSVPAILFAVINFTVTGPVFQFLQYNVTIRCIVGLEPLLNQRAYLISRKLRLFERTRK